MTEILVFYGFLTVAVSMGVGYSLHLYHAHESKRSQRHGSNAHA